MRTNRMPTLGVALAAALATIVLTASCGTPAASTTAPADAQEVAAGESQGSVKLGVVLSLTGKFAESAELMRNAYELWAEEVNERGGLAGRPVELVIHDDESTPETAAILARRLIDSDGVFTVLGPYGSGATDAVAVVMEQAQLPMIASLASDSSLWDKRPYRWSFQAFPNSTSDHEAFVEIAAEQGARTLAIVYEDASFSIAAAKAAEERAAGHGMEVETFLYPPDLQDFGSIVERIAAFEPDAVSMGGYYAPSVTLTNAMIQRGYNPPAYHFIQASQSDTIEAFGENTEGLFGRSSWEPQLDAPGNDEFVAAYNAAVGSDPSYHAAMAYAAGQLLEAAVAEAGLEPAAIREFLATQTAQTIAGEYKANEKGQQVGYRYVGIQWQDGERKVVYPADVAEADVIWPKAEWK